MPRALCPVPLWLCDRHRQWRRSLAAERGGRHPAPEGETGGADAEPWGGCRRHRDAPVSGRSLPPSVRVRLLIPRLALGTQSNTSTAETDGETGGGSEAHL